MRQSAKILGGFLSRMSRGGHGIAQVLAAESLGYTVAMQNDEQKNLHAAFRAVSEACAVARQVQGQLHAVRQMTKDDRSPVTVADFAVQAMVSLSLREALGSPLIVGEEHAGELRLEEQQVLREAVVDAVRSSRRGVDAEQVMDAIDGCDHDGTAEGYWTLDPIDGTKGFLRGQQYAIALARIEGGRVTMGVMGCPNLPVAFEVPLDAADALGCIYTARLGGGAWEQTGTAIDGACRAVKAAPFVADRAVRACESVEAAHSKQDDSVRILQALGKSGLPARLDSQCKYAVVARGQADVYLRLPTSKSYVEKIWDHAAGMLIAQEAGATVSDISGAPLDFSRGRLLESNRGVICAAPGLHDRIIDAIERLGIGAAV